MLVFATINQYIIDRVKNGTILTSLKYQQAGNVSLKWFWITHIRDENSLNRKCVYDINYIYWNTNIRMDSFNTVELFELTFNEKVVDSIFQILFIQTCVHKWSEYTAFRRNILHSLHSSIARIPAVSSSEVEHKKICNKLFVIKNNCFSSLLFIILLLSSILFLTLTLFYTLSVILKRVSNRKT